MKCRFQTPVLEFAARLHLGCPGVLSLVDQKMEKKKARTPGRGRPAFQLTAVSHHRGSERELCGSGSGLSVPVESPG